MIPTNDNYTASSPIPDRSLLRSLRRAGPHRGPGGGASGPAAAGEGRGGTAWRGPKNGWWFWDFSPMIGIGWRYMEILGKRWEFSVQILRKRDKTWQNNKLLQVRKAHGAAGVQTWGLWKVGAATGPAAGCLWPRGRSKKIGALQRWFVVMPCNRNMIELLYKHRWFMMILSIMISSTHFSFFCYAQFYSPDFELWNGYLSRQRWRIKNWKRWKRSWNSWRRGWSESCCIPR